MYKGNKGQADKTDHGHLTLLQPCTRRRLGFQRMETDETRKLWQQVSALWLLNDVWCEHCFEMSEQAATAATRAVQSAGQ